MRHGYWVIRLVALVTTAMLSASLSVAQIEDESVTQIEDDGAKVPVDEVQPPVDTVEPAEEIPAEQTDVVPEPTEVVPEPVDVMRPTQDGFRLTPRLAELGARLWVRDEVGKWIVDLTDEQEAELSRRVARRVMRVAHDHSERGREFFEFFLETQFASQGRMANMPSEMKQEFGERMSEWLPVARELLKDIARDGRPLLKLEQWRQVREGLRDGFKEIDRLERKMRRWAEGGAREGEDINDLDDEAEDKREPGRRSGEEDDAKPVRASEALRRARRWAKAELLRLQRGDWRDFLDNAGYYFKFNDEQMEDGQVLVTHFRKRAATIMTPDWRNRLLENRIKYQLRWKLGAGGETMMPWIYHLEREYNQEIAPLEKIRAKFKRAVIAIATNEQRKTAAAPILERVKEHGLDVDETDITMIEMARD